MPAEKETNGQGSGSAARLVVIGASAGGVEALSRLASLLPEDFPAAIVVVLHVPPAATSVLPAILGRGVLPATHARDGDPIEPGHIYVAPPDEHLLVEDSRVRLTRGPRENNHRPAIDPMFRSAAQAYGRALTAVVLSGVLDDGTAGLRSVKLMGGTTIVQDPDDALYRAMPESAIFHVNPHHVVTVEELAELLVRLTAEVTPREEPPMDEKYHQEPEETMRAEDMAGEPAGVSCPDCGGPLWETQEGKIVRYRCLVGHAYSSDSLVAAQAISLETALWTALRALEDRARTAYRLADRLEKRGIQKNAARFREQAHEAERNAAVVRQVLERTETAAVETPELDTAET